MEQEGQWFNLGYFAVVIHTHTQYPILMTCVCVCVCACRCTHVSAADCIDWSASAKPAPGSRVKPTWLWRATRFMRLGFCLLTLAEGLRDSV